MINYRGETFYTLAEAFEPRRLQTVWQWAEENIILPAGTTPRPGPYSTSWCPYVREPMEAYTWPDVKTIVLCFATRSAKTEIFLNCLRYSVAEERQPCLWAKPNLEDAQNDSEGRFRPSVESSEVLRRLKPVNPNHYRIHTMRFKRSPVYFVGAGSSAQLRNKQIGRLFADEIDTWRRANERETGALENAMERVKDTPYPKILLSSTPTVASAQIWKEFIKGDQRYYHVPCPFCGEFFRFVLAGLRWADDARRGDGTWDLAAVRESVHYLCPKCAGKILDKHKLAMLKAGHWRPAAERLKWEGKDVPVEQGRRSYHLNSLYPEWCHFANFAEKFILSKHDPEAWQSFINQWLAEPYFNWGNTDEIQEALKKAAADSPVLELYSSPPGYKPLMTIDVQQLEVWYRVRAHNAARETIGLDFGVLPSLEDAEELRKRWGCSFVGVDIGYAARLQEVLVFCLQHKPHWVAMRGSGTMYSPIRLATAPIGGGVLKGMPVPCIMVHAVQWKEILTNRIKGGAPRWVNEKNVSDSYKKQMSGEVRKERRQLKGSVIVEYIKVGANHAFDCEYNQLALYDVTRPLLFGLPKDLTTEQKPPEMPPQVARDNADTDSRREEEADPNQLWENEVPT